jgi:hypothetical protein
MLRQIFVCSFAALVAGCVTTREPADPAAVARANTALHNMDQQKVRLAIARILDESDAWGGIIDGGAPRIGESKIRGPLERTDPTGFPYLEYCASAAILPFTVFPKSALITVRQQPGGQTRVKASISRSGVTCTGADQPFPEFEQVRNQRRRAMGKDV